MSVDGKTVGERVSSLETWTESHEQRCDDRQASMGREIGELKEAVAGLTKGAWTVAIALLAWAALQLYGHLDNPQPLLRGAAQQVAGPH